MRALTYTGRSRYRDLGPDDGLDTPRRFERGVPLEVSDADANRILGDPDRFPNFAGDPADDDGHQAG